MELKAQLAAILMALGASAGVARAQVIEDCAETSETSARTLCHQTILAAPAAEVWSLLSTAEGWRTWAAPVAHLELRPGGLIETSYSLQARQGDPGNIRNRIVSFAAEQALVIAIADAPPGFPHEDLARQLATAIELEGIDARHTRVRLTMTGYRDGPGFDQLYDFFNRGNAFTLTKLRERVERGPVDWTAARLPQVENQ